MVDVDGEFVKRTVLIEARGVGAWVLLLGTLLPLPLFVTGTSAGDEIASRPYFAYSVPVILGSLLIVSLCLVSLSRRLSNGTRAVSSAVAWILVWISPMVFVLIAELPVLGFVVAGLLAVGGTAIAVLSIRYCELSTPSGRGVGGHRRG